ncbi:ComEA family DNA-binding protein [Chitinophaga cymbidii]|uniref:ComEA family DNA-binding protein n=1 Tax=Chitinophaga cymbidii TaxID=1096750 RepID=UPI0011BF8F6D|nr:helix-hairpin-helix domain-containing protein [Chitinophaga cymbidii]
MPNKFLTDYCSFSRRERTGIAALLGLVLMLFFLPDVWDVLRKDVETVDTAGFRLASEQLAVMLKLDTVAVKRDYSYRKRTYAADSASRFERYERSDGASGFEKYERPPRFERYERRNAAPRFEKYDRFPRFEKYKRTPPLTALDINTADTLLWERLPGIGPVLSRRIVLFRERLGGFHDIRQVAETYGLADSVFVKIQPLLQLGDVSLRKIDLNKTDEKSLADHPYIDTKLARAVIRYRNNHGPFRSVEGLKAIALVDEVIYRKLEKYLVVN